MSNKKMKIISLLLVVTVVVNSFTLPVLAKGEAGSWEDDQYHKEYEDLSDCPVYSDSDLVYTGEVSTNVMTDFNVLQQFGMDWCKDSGFYMSRPFSYKYRWTDTSSVINLGKKESAYNKMFGKDKFNAMISAYFTNNNLSLDDYDVYYMIRINYSPTREYGYLILDYWGVPKNMRIAMANQNKPEDSTSFNDVYYGIVLSDEENMYQSYWHATCYIYGETKDVTSGTCGTPSSAFYSFLGSSHMNTVATNIPIFTQYSDAQTYVNTGKMVSNPSNKIPNPDVNDRVSADAFGWDSFKCRLVQDGNNYKFVYDYKYSNADMVANPSAYYMDIDYSQVIRYGNRANTTIYQDATANKESQLNINSAGTSTDSISVIDSSGSFGQQFLYYVFLLIDEASSFFGSGFNLTEVDIHSSFIYVTVTLRHRRTSTDNPVVGAVDKVLSDVSSDVRTFKFDALTLENLDNPEELESTVVTKDTTDANGNVTGKEVTQIITNDNSTHTTIYNYYYDSDGNKSTTPGGSSSGGSGIGDSLSDIASGLIKFIKTLVTEGLPAALEILKTVISSISDLIGFALDQIGDVGEGTQNGLIAILKAIPVPLWGICSVGLIVYVIVGVAKKFF